MRTYRPSFVRRLWREVKPWFFLVVFMTVLFVMMWVAQALEEAFQ